MNIVLILARVMGGILCKDLLSAIEILLITTDQGWPEAFWDYYSLATGRYACVTFSTI
jgi:hypothetical protein